jgi:hypothetical protein
MPQSSTLSGEVDLTLIAHYDQRLTDLELSIVRAARHHHASALYLLQTVSGIGKLLSLVRLYDIHDIDRFSRVRILSPMVAWSRGPRNWLAKA